LALARIPDFYSHIVTFGSASTLSRLIDFVELCSLDPEPVVHIVVRKFPSFLRQLRWTSLRGLLHAIQSLRSVGLRGHARLLTGFIPLDIETILHALRTLSPHRAARFIKEIAKGNHDMFRAFAHQLPASNEIATTLWEKSLGRIVASRKGVQSPPKVGMQSPLRLMRMGPWPGL
jgi:hypothetical protein